MEEKKRRQGGKGEGPKLDIGGVYLKLFHVALALCSASGASYHYEDKRMLAEIILSFGPRGGRPKWLYDQAKGHGCCVDSWVVYLSSRD